MTLVARPSRRSGGRREAVTGPAIAAQLRAMFLATLDRLTLDQLIPSQVTARDGWLTAGRVRIDLSTCRRIIIVAFGKAGVQMADAVVSILAPRPVVGIVSGVEAPARPSPGLAYFQGGHPYPNSDSFAAGRAVAELLEGVTESDLVLYLLSGGGSAICELPGVPGVSLEDWREFYRVLVTCGANVVDVNFLRKHVSAIKGGRLAARAWPARQLTLYVSDAPPGRPSNVASGPTMPDESTVEDCYRIVDEHGLLSRLPAALRAVFEERRLDETPKAGAPVFDRSDWHCLLSPEDALETLADVTRQAGWVVETDHEVDDDCPLERATRHLIDRAVALQRAHPDRMVAVLAGGEFSCPVAGPGLGGRNQAFVLDAVPRIAGRSVAVLSAGTDGIDGVSPAAGAVADGDTLARATRLGLDPADYARRSDSYGFWSRLGDTIVTGPTGNNVRDLRMVVAW